MKLLFDENLSPRLPNLLAREFPESRHVRDCGLRGKADRELWEFARDEGFVIISKDSDFLQQILIHGAPPKLVWLRIGNCTRDELLRLILSKQADIRKFDTDGHQTVLVLS